MRPAGNGYAADRWRLQNVEKCDASMVIALVMLSRPATWRKARAKRFATATLFRAPHHNPTLDPSPSLLGRLQLVNPMFASRLSVSDIVGDIR